MKIVAIGGGEIGRPGYKIETLSIDKEVVRLTGKKHPKLLFLPTASGDSDSYYNVVKKYYGKKLGCRTDVLYLIKREYSRNEIENRILNSDIVYVGGGNTLRMLKIWRKLGVDNILRSASGRNIVLSGVSAGMICWFSYGNSDSLRFGKTKRKKIIRIKGLGLIDFLACPHFNTEKNRKLSLRKMIRDYGGVAIALDNCVAIEIVDGKYRILASSKHGGAYRVYRRGKKIIQEHIPVRKDFSPLEDIATTL